MVCMSAELACRLIVLVSACVFWSYTYTSWSQKPRAKMVLQYFRILQEYVAIINITIINNNLVLN